MISTHYWLQIRSGEVLLMKFICQHHTHKCYILYTLQGSSRLRTSPSCSMQLMWMWCSATRPVHTSWTVHGPSWRSHCTSWCQSRPWSLTDLSSFRWVTASSFSPPFVPILWQYFICHGEFVFASKVCLIINNLVIHCCHIMDLGALSPPPASPSVSQQREITEGTPYVVIKLVLFHHCL